MSLRRQFVLVFVAFAVLVSVLGGGMAYRAASGALEEELDRRLVQVAGAAAQIGFDPGLLLSFRPGDENQGTYLAMQASLNLLRSYVDEALIVRMDNTPPPAPVAIVTTRPLDSAPIGAKLYDMSPFIPDIEVAADSLGRATTEIRTRADDGQDYKYGFVRLGQSEVILAVRMPADYQLPLSEFRQNVFLGSILAAVVAALLAWALATTVTGSLNRLGRVALRIQRGHMDEPVRRERGGDLGRLSRAMERMRLGILNRDEQLRLMLAQVAHEIRNPLGGLELLASEAAVTEDAEKQGRLLGKVRSEIYALNRIIDDFLTFARPLRPEVELHDMREPVREAVSFVEMEMRGSGHELIVDLPDEVVMARAEPEHIKRVTLNLVRNAAQAGERVQVSCVPYRGEAVLVVSDNGPGVPEDMRERIFDPFVTDKEKGAGLGLAIVKRVVEANHGRVELSRDGGPSGEGAEFRVYFRGGEDFTPEKVES